MIALHKNEMKTVRRWEPHLAVLSAVLLTAAALLVGGHAAKAGESSARKVTFDIPAQSMATALLRFSEQAGIQITAEGATLKVLNTQGLRGDYPAPQALDLLLKGSGLTYKFVDGETIVVRWARDTAASTAMGGKDDRVDDLRLARVENDPAGTMPKVISASGEGGRNSGRAAVETSDDESSRGTPEILVKGKRSLNTDIRRTEDDPQPYVVYDREQIERSQALNLEDFLRTRLPMNTSSASNGQNASGSSANATSGINLRGLGTNQTLILVDGRRMAGVANRGSPQQPDLNGIPLSAIERIEVLPSTASGIYGGSATGGVVNIVLRHDFQNLEAKATYANTFDSDTGLLRLDASAGFSLGGGRTQVMIAASRSQANTLAVGDRDFAQRAFAMTMRSNPGAVLDSPNPPLGGTVNIRSTGGNLVLDPQYGGASLGFGMTHLSPGYAGPDSDDGAQLVANAGSYNTALPAGVAGRDQSLVIAPVIESASLNVRHELNSRLEAFMDLSSLGNQGKSTFAGMTTWAYGLPADAPNNPFQQTINASFPAPPHLSAETRSNSTTVRAAGGLIARLPRDWMGEIDYGWSRSRLRTNGTWTMLYSDANTALSTGLSVGGRPALNALQEGNTYPVDFGPYLLPSPNHFQGPYDTVLKDVTFRLSGPAMTLPGGPVNLSFLLERRNEELSDGRTSEILPSTGDFAHYFYPHRSQGADSYYLEARIPVISRDNARGWAKELALQASVRRDEYNTRSSQSASITLPSPDAPVPALNYSTAVLESTDYTLGLRYSPLQDLTLRASLGTGFLPPSVNQITPRSIVINFGLGVTDPRRGDTNPYVGLPWTLINGGNPDLKPERSESWSAGLILTPRFAPGLRLSIDYTQIDKVDEIQGPGFQYVLDNEDSLSGRIVRGEKLPGDPAEWAGRIVSLNNTLINIAKTSLEAYDVQLDYTVQTQRFGDVNWYALATWQPHYENQRFATDPIVDRVGFADGLLEWRGNLGFDWTLGAWSLGWNMQYYDSYFVYNSTSSNPTMDLAVLNQGSDTIPSQMYHDLIATYRFDHAAGFAGGLLANSEISLGIQNTFNTSPPIIASQSTTDPGYSRYGDPRLRRYSIAFRRAFGK